MLFWQDMVNDFTCVCLDGWEGKTCEGERDECVDGICNDGRCTVSFFLFVCLLFVYMFLSQ